MAYANNGLVSQRSEGSGASSAAYGWDDINRLTSQSDVFQFNINNVAWTFAYNPASQIVTETRSNDSYGFTKLAASTAYAVNGLNQYTSVGGTARTYDANGNLTGTGSVTYTYDIENRLVKAVAGATTTNLVYDPLGRLFETNQGTSATMTRFLTDGDTMVLELSGSNDVTNRFVHGSNAAADDPLVWYSGANLASKRWLHADHLGSIAAWTNSSGGSPTINRYDEYGLPSATNSGRFQYTGQAWIGELGLYYYKARFYSAALGRFMQTDPVGYEDDINLYAYVGNDPVNRNDPRGLYQCNTAATRLCETDQKQAIRQLAGSLRALTSLARDLRAGNKLSNAERQIQSRLDKYLGAGAGRNLGTINRLISSGNAIMGVLRSNAPIVTHSQMGTTYMRNRGGLTSPMPTLVFPRYFEASERTRIFTLIHEPAHKALGARDWGIYGSERAEAFARTNPSDTFRSADNIAFALGFERDDD